MSPAPVLPTLTAHEQASSLLVSLQDHLATTSPSTDSPLPLVSVIKQVQRLASSTIVHAKAQTAEVRIGMDKRGLELMGLEYEKRRLVSEINRCEEFDSIYESVPLHAASLSSQHPQNHEQVLAALKEELASMERLKSQRIHLQRQGDLLAREIKDTKTKTAGLDDVLKDFGKMAAAIQNKFQTALPPTTSA